MCDAGIPMHEADCPSRAGASSRDLSGPAIDKSAALLADANDYLHSRTGTCPHCRLGVRFESVCVDVGFSPAPVRDRVRCETLSGHWLEIASVGCPACGRLILNAVASGAATPESVELGLLLWPDATDRAVPKEVEAESPEIGDDFKEAAAVLSRSRKASAALARRCLQCVLTTKGGAKAKNLAQQIDEVIGNLPS